VNKENGKQYWVCLGSMIFKAKRLDESLYSNDEETVIHMVNEKRIHNTKYEALTAMQKGAETEMDQQHSGAKCCMMGAIGLKKLVDACDEPDDKDEDHGR